MIHWDVKWFYGFVTRLKEEVSRVRTGERILCNLPSKSYK
jgi:hypothetical protein